jgi:hypothetical protein
MPSSALTRNAQVLRYLIEVAPGAGHTILAKLAYLADLLARQHLGHPITSLDYIYDKHGPFDASRFYSALSELEHGGFMVRERADLGGYLGYPMLPLQPLRDADLTDAEKEILTWVGRTYGSLTARDLCERVVYETTPMKSAKRGQRLPMEESSRTDALEFDLERVLAGERAAEEGRVRPLASVFNELRARHHK